MSAVDPDYTGVCSYEFGSSTLNLAGVYLLKANKKNTKTRCEYVQS